MSNQEKVVEKQDLKETVWSVKRVSIIAVFIALSAVGSMIKIPSPIGTIGLDSAPGYFCALAFGPVEGAAVIAIGHMLSSAVVGFPLSIPIDIFVAVQMAVWAIIFRLINNRYNVVLAIIAATILNGIVSAFTLVLVGGMGMVIGVMPFLTVASAINIIISAIAYKVVKGSKLI
ncbi:MAG: alpha-ribazole transporter [Clostridia bacterium BRH_c25]|nr:MAG: alpha-ribazole transporter [Clostridia bacterium BRH_c25]